MQPVDLEHLESLASGGDRGALRELVRALQRTNAYRAWRERQPFPARVAVRFETVAELPIEVCAPSPGGRFVAGRRNKTTLVVYDLETLDEHGQLTNLYGNGAYAVSPDGWRVAELRRGELRLLDTRLRGARRIVATRSLPPLPMAHTGQLPSAEQRDPWHHRPGETHVEFDADGRHLWLAHYADEPDADGVRWPRLALLDADTLEEVDAVGPQTLRWETWQRDEGDPMFTWGFVTQDPRAPGTLLGHHSIGDSFMGFQLLGHRDGRIDRELAGPQSLAVARGYRRASDGDPLWDALLSTDGRLFVLDSLGKLSVLHLPGGGCATGYSVAPFGGLGDVERSALLSAMDVDDSGGWLSAGWGGLWLDADDHLLAELSIDDEPQALYAFDAVSLAPLGRVEPAGTAPRFALAGGRLFARDASRERGNGRRRRTLVERLVRCV